MEVEKDSLFSSPIHAVCFSFTPYTTQLGEFLLLIYIGCQLYTFGSWGGFFCMNLGYTITTWLVVLNLASTGLLVSWLIKYADNIVKVYSTSMAMLLTMVLSVFLFTFKPTLQLLLGIIICIMSLHMYFAPPSSLVDLTMAVKTAPQSGIEVSVDRRTNS